MAMQWLTAPMNRLQGIKRHHAMHSRQMAHPRSTSGLQLGLSIDSLQLQTCTARAAAPARLLRRTHKQSLSHARQHKAQSVGIRQTPATNTLSLSGATETLPFSDFLMIAAEIPTACAHLPGGGNADHPIKSWRAKARHHHKHCC